MVLKPGHVVLEVGANIGAHTLALAQLIGLTGMVLAFEPQRILFQSLCANMALNSIPNVRGFHAAVGSSLGQVVVPLLDYNRDNNFGGLELGNHRNGEIVPAWTIDGLKLGRYHLLKIDVEGAEQSVLEGAVESIRAHAPILYVENDRQQKSDALIRFIDGLGYNMYWHTPLLFNSNNFAANPVNVFGQTGSLNMLCLPKKLPQQVSGLQSVRVP